MMSPLEGIDDAGRPEHVPRQRAARVLGRAGQAGVIAAGDDGLDVLVRPQRPEPGIPGHEAVQVGSARPVDAYDEHRPDDLLPLDHGMAQAFAGEFRVVPKEPAHVEGDVADPIFRQARLGRVERLHKLLQPFEHPLGVGVLEGDAVLSGVTPRLLHQPVEVQTAARLRIGPVLAMRPHPPVMTHVAGQRAQPFNRLGAVLANGAVADRERRGRLGPSQPIASEVIEHRPIPGHGRGVAASLAGAPEGLVRHLRQIQSELLERHCAIGRRRIAAVVEREPSFRVQ